MAEALVYSPIQELRWIVDEYLPPHYERMLSILNACLAACREGDKNGNTPSLFPCATLVLSTVGTDVLKGFVTLDGPKIEKAEIQILLPAWNKGHPIQMRLDPDSPIIMPQISSCALLVSNAMEQLSLAQSEAQPVEVARLLTEAIKYCRSALSLLSNVDGQQPLVVGKLLDPPEGLIVSFGVQNARILATAYISGGHEGSSSNSLNNSTQGSSASTVRSMSRGSIGGSVLPKSLSTSYKTIDRGSGIVSPGTTSNHTETLVRVDSAVPALTATNEMLQHVIHNLTMLRTQMQKILGLVVNNIDKIH